VRGLRWALPQEDEGHKIPFPTKALRGLVLATAVLAGLFSLYFLSNLAILAGTAMIGILGSFGFVGTFLNDLGEILRMVLAALAALAGGGVLSGLANRLGNLIDRRAAPGVRKILTTILSPCAGMLLFVLILQTIDWFYLLENQAITLWWPAAIGATAGLALALFMKPKDNLPVGMVIYYAARTIFNALRSIESLVMVIVFVVWVGIGPFAGVLALSLHTIAALAKLYSEQVESIMTGPVEAVKATGANRLQTIIYAVIPQIIPPYISFTMYRWDINVRMSTIIGFAGGGGIGFLLIQNINLLNYHAASVQMLAIAVVVASMDYLSSRMREEVI
jgi:phosphonate ABC transporter permease subunit PhnE